MKCALRVLCALTLLLLCYSGFPAFANCNTNTYTQPAPSQFLASFAPGCVFTYSPTLLYIHDVASTGSYSFSTSDFYQQTNRSNGGTAMTDTLPGPGTGLVTGAVVQIRNADSTATDTITPNTYTIEGNISDTIAPGQTVEYVLDTTLSKWWKVLNAGAQGMFATTVGNTSGDVVEMANTGVGVADSGVGINTSGNSLCPVSQNCVFSGANTFTGLATVSNVQFSGVPMGSSQQINDQLGSSFASVARLTTQTTGN
jgi:hypothetical protein